MDLNIAVHPLEIAWGQKEENLKRIAEVCASLHPATDLLVLPETCTTGFPSFGKDKEEVRKLAERNTGATIDFLKELSDRHNLAICGSFIADTGGLLFNRAFFIEPGGEDYFADKRHLFTMAGEDKVFSPGDTRLQVRYRGWNIAMVVCYDIRFPAWCRNRSNEYDLLVAVANWPQVRVDAWNKLLPARAIENLCYLAAADCRGTDENNFVYDGSSAILDFKGLSVATEMDGTLYAMLSKEKLDRFRDKFPAWRDSDDFSLTTSRDD